MEEINYNIYYHYYYYYHDDETAAAATKKELMVNNRKTHIKLQNYYNASPSGENRLARAVVAKVKLLLAHK